MPEGGEGGDAGGIDEVAGVGEDVDVCSERPDLEVKCEWVFSHEKEWFQVWRGVVKNDTLLLTFWPAIRQRDSVESA